MSFSTKFSNYLPLSDADKTDLIENGTIVFDTNVLLAFYKWAPLHRTDVFSLFKSHIKKRAWLPNHVALEFLQHRWAQLRQDERRIPDARDKLSKVIVDAVASIEAMELEKLGSKLKTSDATGALNKAVQPLLDDLDQLQKTYPVLRQRDEVLDFIDEFFGDRIGEPFTLQEELNRLYEEGEARYKAGIPPGYKDSDKDEKRFFAGGLEYRRKFGDLIIWRQITNAVRQDSARFSRLVFVTADSKEDWWHVESGETLGPRPELRHEIAAAGATLFHMYPLTQFVRILSERAGKKVSAAALEDVKTSEQAYNAQRQTIQLREIFGRTKLGIGALDKDVLRCMNLAQRWLTDKTIFGNVSLTNDFPDFVVREGGLLSGTTGYEVLVPKTPRALIMQVVELKATFAVNRDLRSDKLPEKLVAFVMVDSDIGTGRMGEWKEVVAKASAVLESAEIGMVCFFVLGDELIEWSSLVA